MAVKALTIIVSGQILKLVLSLVLQILIARYLLPEGRGVYGICIASASILLIATFLGNEYGIRYLLAWKKITSLQAFWYLLVTAAISLVASIVLIWLTAIFDFRIAENVTYLQLSLAILLAFSQLITTQLNVFMTINGKYLEASAFAVGEEVIKLALVSLMLAYNATVELALVSIIFGNIITSILAIIHNRYYLCDLGGIRLQDIAFIYRYGFRSFWLNLANVSNTHLGTLILSGLMPADRVGIYNIAFGLISRVQVIPDSLNRILVPESIGSNDGKSKLKMIRVSVSGLLVLSIIVLAAFGMLYEPIIILMFGAGYADVGPIALYLLIGFLFKVIGKPIEAHFNEIAGKPIIIAMIQVFGVMVMAVFTYLGAGYFGLPGAAIGSAIAIAISAMVLLVVYAKSTRQTLSELFDFRSLSNAVMQIRAGK